MALNTVKEGNVVTRLADSTVLPKMVTVRQLLDHSHIDPADLPELVRTELEPMRGRIRPGCRWPLPAAAGACATLP